MNRSAFTLVEGLIGAALVLLGAMILGDILAHGLRREARVDARIDAARSALLAAGRIGDDFSQLVPFVTTSAHAREASSGVVFDRAPERLPNPDQPPVTDDLTPLVQAVNYRYDPKSHHLLRDGHSIGTLERLSLSYDPASAEGYTLTLALPGNMTLRFHSPLGTLATQFAGDMPP